MNRITPKKLLLSKWTAVNPLNKRKHFLVTSLIMDDQDEEIIGCVMEAVIDKHETDIKWQELRDTSRWKQGWK